MGNKRIRWIHVAIIFGLLILVFTTSTPSTVQSQSPNIPQIIESDDPLVTQIGTWATQHTSEASGGSYLFSSGSLDDVLTLEFEGTSVEIIYVEHATLGSFAIDIDNTIHRTVVTNSQETSFGNRAVVNYLDDGHHTLRIYPVDGVIGIDAFSTTIASSQTNQRTESAEGFDILPTNIILIIGDGMGFEHIQAGGYFINGTGGQFPFESFPYIAEMTIGMASDDWTDSAASATAMATGNKVNDGVLSLALPGNGSELETIVEYLQPLGISTGLITTDQAASATPAAFVAHNSSRQNYQAITADILATKPNLYFAGDNSWMTPTTAAAVGYTVIEDRDELLSFDTASATYVSGQFGSWSMPYEYDGYPSDLPHLFEMTSTALNILDNNPNGFLLVIENEHTDSAGHINDIQRSVYEVNAVAEAVQSTLDWANGRTDTLIIVTADHETGGLNVLQNNGQGNLPTVSWTNTNHSSRHVPVYAWGAGADRIHGVIDNTDIYRILRGWEPLSVGGVTITPSEVNIPAGNTTATYSIVLQSQPSSPVDISFETKGLVEVDTDHLTFTESSWDIPQIVTVLATGDGQITHITESNDETYDYIYLVDNVSVTVGNFPNAPSNFSATANGSTQIDLAWSDNASDETAFHIERSLNGTDWAEIDTVAADTTTYQDTVDCGTTYHYRVRAFRSGDSVFSTYSNTDQATSDLCPLPAPSNLIATANGSTQINLAWSDNSADESAFHIERSLNGTDWAEIDTVPADTTTYQDTVDCGTTYHYRVRAFRSGDSLFSTYSNTDQATTDACPLPAPSNFSATANGSTQINLAWSDNASDETAFHIERSLNGTDWAEIDTVPANTTVYQDTVDCGTSYHYRVRAFRSGDSLFSAYSNTDQATTDLCPLPAPSNFSATANGSTQIDLAWSDNASDETAFHIERSLNGTDWAEIDTVPADTTTYQDTVDCGTTYHYRVRAFRSGDSLFSTYSNTDQATTDPCPLPAPSNFSATANGSTQINLAWSDNASDETAFHIERSLNGTDWAEIDTVPANTTVYQDTVDCGTSYHYRVRAFRSGDGVFSTYSNTDQATSGACPLPAPSNLSATSNSSTQIDLAWSDNSADESAFHIERSLNGTDWAEIDTVSADTTTYQDTVDCGTTYHYRVRAFRSGDSLFSTYSNTDQATSDPCALPAPSNFSATANGSTQINLAWSDNASDETAFHIERSLNGTDWAEIDTVPANTTVYQDTVDCGTSYHYRVRAFRSGDGVFSTYSNTDQATSGACPLPAPSNLSATSNSSTQIDLAWSDNSSDETAFHIERSLNATDWAEIDTVIADTTAYQDTVDCGTTYHYRVRAFRSGDGVFSIYSNTDQATSDPCTSENPSLIAPLNTTITDFTTLPPIFSWNEAADTTNFHFVLTKDTTTVLDAWYQKGNSSMTCNGSTCQVIPTVSLANGEYQWYIQGVTPTGNTQWTPPGNFTIQIPVPAAINKTAPANTATLSSGNVTFTWDREPNATHYQLALNGVSTWYGANAVCNASTCSVNRTLANGAYTWYVQGYGVGGNGSWGSPFTFTIEIPKPGIINKLAPIGSQSSATPTFSWTHDPNATWYYLWIGNPTNTFYTQWISASSACSGATCSFDTGQTFNGNFVWYVYGLGDGGAGPWGSPTNFSYTLTLNSPAGNVSGTNITYEWSDAGSTTTYYHLWVGMNGGSTVVDQWVNATSCNGTICSFTATGTLPNGNYTWYIQPYGPTYGNGAWSAPQSFSVNP